MKCKVMVSGGFDPLHEGHVSLLKEAASLGAVVVALNSDEWLERKKGRAFQKWGARAAILGSIRYVEQVVPVNDLDDTVCQALLDYRPVFFANGGDRTKDTTPELRLCEELGIHALFNVGGGKSQSSSALIAAGNAPHVVERAWGNYVVLYDGPLFKVKLLTLTPLAATSIQRHKYRAETWVYPTGTIERHEQGRWHQLRNPYTEPLPMIEVQTGGYFGEDDIERIEQK